MLADHIDTLAAELEQLWERGEVSGQEYEAGLAEVAELRELESEVAK